MKGHPLDPEGRVAVERCALVYAPRRDRERYPENCVQIVDDEAAARAGADPARKLYPAKVVGPSVSSEGLRVYYLVCWLD